MSNSTPKHSQQDHECKVCTAKRIGLRNGRAYARSGLHNWLWLGFDDLSDRRVYMDSNKALWVCDLIDRGQDGSFFSPVFGPLPHDMDVNDVPAGYRDLAIYCRDAQRAQLERLAA